MQKNKIFLIALALTGLTAGFFILYHRFYRPYKFHKLTEKIIARAIAELDTERMAGQLIHIAIPGTELNDAARRVITRIKPGGIIFFGFNLQNAAQVKKLTTDLQTLAAELKLPPLLIATDQEGGYVKRVQDGVLQTPPAWDLGATRDSALCRSTGYYVSRDLGELGINVFFAPVVDINNNPENPVIGLRAFGADLATVTGCALPFEQGARAALLAGGALPVIKHFPGHGDTHTDSHWALPVIDKSLDQLRQFELVPFREAIAQGARAVMTAHILYPQVDLAYPATLSEKWLTGVLRNEIGFSGLVFTDAMEMNAVSQSFRTVDRPVTAIRAGADVLLYTSWQEDPLEAQAQLIAAIDSGALKLGHTDDGQALPLSRALENQLVAKLPWLKLEQFLVAEEAKWYRQFAAERNQDALPIAHSREELQQRLAAIQWTTKKKRGGPVWLAGRKNADR